MSNSKLVPNIRFKKFKIQWAKYKFANILDKNNGIRRGPFGSSLRKDLFVNKSDYVVYEQQNAIYNMYKTRYNINKSKFEELQKFELQPGDFIMSGAGTIGKISEVPLGIKPGVFNQALIRFKINKKTTSRTFFLTFMRSYTMQRKLKEKNPGSAIYNLVSMKEVKNFSIIIPDKQEQQKIGDLFTKLDKLLDLQKQKIEKLELLKKALLQKLFPNHDAKIPELRFKGYEKDWEKDLIGNVSATRSGGTPSITKKQYYDGNIPFIRSSDINKFKTELYINDNAVKHSSAFIVEKGNVLYALYGATSGQVALSKVTGAINQAVLAIFPKHYIEKKFLMYWFIYNKKKIVSKYLQGGQGNLSAKIIKNLMFCFPNKSEQQKIGNLLSKVDQLIELENKKLEDLQQFKKCLLQNMFVD